MKGIFVQIQDVTIDVTSIFLVPLSSLLIPEYLSLFSPTVRSCLGVSSIYAEYLYLLDCLVRMSEKKTLFYCIFSKKDNQLIGAIEIRSVFLHHTSQIYIWVNEKFWGNGYFKKAMHQALYFYFLCTNFSYVVAHVDVDNKRSYYAFKSFGFADWGFCVGPRGKQYCLVFRAPVK